MKYIMTFVIVVSVALSLMSQSYSVQYNDGTQTRWVHITIDTNYTSTSVYVEKEIVQSSVGTVLTQHTLLLLGNYSYNQNDVNLNYSAKNYFYIPFDPSDAFYSLDQIAGSTVLAGTLT